MVGHLCDPGVIQLMCSTASLLMPMVDMADGYNWVLLTHLYKLVTSNNSLTLSKI